MFLNFFKTAIRNLFRNRFYTIINILGLTVGLTVGLLIMLWVQDEFSFDRFNHQSIQIFRVYANMGTENEKQIWGGVQAPVATWAKKEIPQVVNAVRIRGNWDFTMFSYKHKQFIEGKTAYVDPSFFSVFDFKLLKGSKSHPFDSPNSIIITASEAKKYFGNEDPIGKILVANKTQHFVVNGLIADFPENSSIKYDMLLPLALYSKNFTGNGAWKTVEQDWGSYAFDTYLLLSKATDPLMVEKKITQIHIHNQLGATDTYLLRDLTKLHLYNPDGTAPRLKSVEIFIAVALFVLLIACINYINLTTARSMLRNKEVSVRKIIGASKGQLFFQFMIETVLLFVTATILAFLFIYILIPSYNRLTDKHLSLHLIDLHLWATLGITLLITLIVASIYPAFLLSSFKPIESLRGRGLSGGGNTFLRKALVVTQFVFSITLIIGTILIGKQLRYLHEKELGYDKEHVISFAMGEEMQKHYQTAKAQLLLQPGISAITSSSNNIVTGSNSTGDVDWDGKVSNKSYIFTQISTEENFIPTFKIKVAEGSNFKGVKADSSHFILNETAIKLAGIKNPIGKRFKFHGNNGIIIGVVKDFHFASLKETIKPLILYYSPGQNFQINIKTKPQGATEAMMAAAKVWKGYNSNFPFEAHFLDEIFDELYKSDTRTGILFNLFAFVAIMISCLGLFGLAAFTAQVKTKEIGIRKVLGASVTGIVALLASDFIKLVLIAVVIASPIAWFTMGNYLQEFAYRITISWWVFVISALMAIMITVLTVSFQSLKAALANPVKSLKAE